MDALTEHLPVSYADVAGAAARVAGHAHRTPVLTSRTINARVGAEVFFKCENFQRIGAFKFRGAYNALAQLGQEQKRRGVLAYSSGNHAQAIALAGQLLGVATVIVMPEDAPPVKLEATRRYGAEVITYDTRRTTREALGRSIAAERGLTLIPPYDHPHVVAGQGTAALELIEEVGALDFLFVPCGGGGLLSGCAIAAKGLARDCKAIGVEPEGADDATRSFRTQSLQTCQNPRTIADGARTPSLGQITFPLVLAYAHDMMTVSDHELLEAMRYVWERVKIVVEPTGALGAAGLFKGAHDVRGKRVGIIISGGNVDLKTIAPLIA
jgi:threo-3-hydroxy-L-aspartate ammonia-lyase